MDTRPARRTRLAPPRIAHPTVTPDRTPWTWRWPAPSWRRRCWPGPRSPRLASARRWWPWRADSGGRQSGVPHDPPPSRSSPGCPSSARNPAAAPVPVRPAPAVGAVRSVLLVPCARASLPCLGGGVMPRRSEPPPTWAWGPMAAKCPACAKPVPLRLSWRDAATLAAACRACGRAFGVVPAEGAWLRAAPPRPPTRPHLLRGQA